MSLQVFIPILNSPVEVSYIFISEVACKIAIKFINAEYDYECFSSF